MSEQRAASQPTASQEASQFAAEALGLEYVPRPRSSREEDSRTTTTTTTQPPLAALAEAAAAALPRAEIDDSGDDDDDNNGDSSSDAAVADARYTYCGLCKSKHTKKMWGTWHRVTRDLATLARDRLGQPVAEGSFVCHNGYLNIMAVPGAPPVQIMPPFVPKQRSTSDINAALSQSLAAAAAVAVHKMISRQPSVPPSPATTAAAAAAAAAAANLPSAHLRAQQLASQHIVNRVLRDHELQQADSAERKSGSGSESEESRMRPAPAKRHRASFSAASTAASAAAASSSSSAQQQSVGTMTEPLFSTSALVPRSVLLPKQEPRSVSPAFPVAAAAAAAAACAEDPKTPPTPLAIDPSQSSPEMLAKVVEERIGARVDALAQTLENVNATCTALRATLDELSLRMSAQPTAEELRQSLQSVCQVLQDLRRRDDRS